MDINSLTTTALSALNSSSTSTDIGLLVLGKQLDVSETLGDNMVHAMELSVNPSVGGNIDVSV